MGIANMAEAADWSFVPSITQRSEFNSNLNYTPTNPISDYILSLGPAADFNYTTEIAQLQGHLGIFAQHYISHDNFDHIDQNFQINGQYQMAPKVNLSLNTSYINDSTLVQELLTSGLVIGRTPRQSLYAGPGITYTLTERLMASANYSFNRVLYQSPLYQNYTDQQAGLTLTYLFKNEKTSLISNNIVRYSQYAGGNDYKSIGIYVGLAHHFSERWDANVMGGANINFYSFNTQVLDSSQFPFFIAVKTKTIDSSGVSPYVNFSTTYRWTNLTAAAYLSINQQPSAYGAIYQVNQVGASLSYNFTEKLSGSLSGGYSLSNQASQILSSEWSYFNFGPSLNYQITEQLAVSPGYRYGNSASQTSTGGSAHNHVA